MKTASLNILSGIILTAVLAPLAPAQSRSRTEISAARQIVYFGPADSDLDVLNGKEPDAALDDFRYYISRADSALKSLGIKTAYNNSERIDIPFGEDRSVTVDRRAQVFGYIFTDGRKKPLVIDYVLTDTELVETARDYFNLK